MKALLLVGLISSLTEAGELRLHQLQSIGTHNSYHLAPSAEKLKLLGFFSKRATTAWDYSRKPLGEQLKAGLRHFELDIFADPKGGIYAKSDCPNDDPMRQPGMKVLHVPRLDAGSIHPTFKGALRSVKEWSDKNPRHIPVMILLELKDRHEVPFLPKPVVFDRGQMEEVEKEILSIFERPEIITPDEVRGKSATLRESILAGGWPRLERVRGKVMFCLDNEGTHRDIYLKGNRSLEERLFFVSVGPKHPAAAWMKRNEPVRRFAEIQKLVKAGFMVRTRADAETKEARVNDMSRANKALASGAQFVSTDFPEKVPRISEYEVTFPGAIQTRVNPLSDKKENGVLKE